MEFGANIPVPDGLGNNLLAKFKAENQRKTATICQRDRTFVFPNH